MTTWVARVGQYEPIDLFVCGQSSPFFSRNVEGVVVDQVFLRCLICPSIPEIFDQSRNLSKIGPKFGRSFGPRKFFFWGGRVFQKLYALSPLRCGTSSGEVS